MHGGEKVASVDDRGAARVTGDVEESLVWVARVRAHKGPAKDFIVQLFGGRTLAGVGGRIFTGGGRIVSGGQLESIFSVEGLIWICSYNTD